MVMKNLYIIIFIFVIPKCGFAFVCNPDSVTKIELIFDYKSFISVQESRYAWLGLREGGFPTTKEMRITDMTTISDIMSDICNAEKYQDLNYDVYDPAVELKEIGNKCLADYIPLTPPIEGIMLIYTSDNMCPELLWLYGLEFDRGKTRYKLPKEFWTSIYSRYTESLSGN